MSFADPELLDPEVHCFARCYACGELFRLLGDEDGELLIEERKCPKCGVFNEEDQVRWSFYRNLYHTASIASANKFLSLDPAVIPMIGAGIVGLLADLPWWFRLLNAAVYLGQPVMIARWFYRYWYLARFDDEEYLTTLTAIKRSALLWTAANTLNWTLLLF